ncbi:retrovirus-related pol polyprotein from transposon TNT 1-94 [Tanacetum coccineum]
MYHLLNVLVDQVDAKLRIEVENNNALEFVKGPLALFLADKGIEYQTTCVDRPQRNGKVERKHKHILEIVVLNTPNVSSQDLPTSSTTVHTEILVRKSSKTSKPPNWTNDFEVPTLKPAANQVTSPNMSSQFYCFLSNLVTQQDPKTFKEAVRDARWCDAMNVELRDLEENDTWELIDLTPDKKAIISH